MMTDLYTKFIRGVRWNTFEAISYYALYSLHNIALFAILEPGVYGLSGTILSLLYLTVMITNIGFDQTIGPFFSYYSSSRDSFKHLFLYQLVIQMVLLGLSGTFLVGLLGSWFSTYQLISVGTGSVIVATVISEGVKRSTRTLMQVSFKNKATSLIEVTSMILYGSIVWSWYLLVGQITIPVLLSALLISSLAGLMSIGTLTMRWYQYLPAQASTRYTQSIRNRIIKSRLVSWAYGITQQLFSSNTIIPLIATHAGLQQAGTFTMINSLVSSITGIFNKIAGYPSLAALAHTKYQSIPVKQETFRFISTEIMNIMYSIGLFIAINRHTLITRQALKGASPDLIVPIYLYIGIILLEYAIIGYEKFYLNEEKPEYLVGMHIGIIAIACGIIMTGSSWGLTTILGTLACIRILSFVALAALSYRHWGIRPSLKVKPLYLIISALSALIFLLIAR